MATYLLEFNVCGQQWCARVIFVESE